MTSIDGASAEDGIRPSRPTGSDKNVRLGVFAALGAYGMWGLFPLFFKLLDGIDSPMIVAYRSIFALVFVAVILLFRKEIRVALSALKDRRTLLAMLASTLLLAANWLIFVWAVESGQVLQTSFGYFINPLVNIAIGMVLLGERQSRMQAVAIGIALIAVAIQAVGLGSVPWVALSLAITFAFYGYFRKTVSIGSMQGLFVETLLLTPLAVGYAVYGIVASGGLPFDGPLQGIALVASGPLTALALIFFGYAARQLRLTTIGMFQYIAPSLAFLSAIFILGETLSLPVFVSFALIWVSLVVFSYDSWRRRGS